MCLRLHSCRKPLVQDSLRTLRGSARTAGHQLHTLVYLEVAAGGRRGHLTALLGQARKVVCPLYLCFPGGNLADLSPSSQNCVRMYTIPSSSWVTCLVSPQSGGTGSLYGFVATQADSVTTAARGDSYHFWHRGRALGEEAEDCISNLQQRAVLSCPGLNYAGPDWGPLPN